MFVIKCSEDIIIKGFFISNEVDQKEKALVHSIKKYDYDEIIPEY
jgi:hypothetical protein